VVIGLAEDADRLVRSGKYGGLCLYSSDSSFVPLVTRVQRVGLPVYGFGTASASPALVDACTAFYAVQGVSTEGGTEEQQEQQQRRTKGLRELSDVALLATFHAASGSFGKPVPVSAVLKKLRRAEFVLTAKQLTAQLHERSHILQQTAAGVWRVRADNVLSRGVLEAAQEQVGVWVPLGTVGNVIKGSPDNGRIYGRNKLKELLTELQYETCYRATDIFLSNCLALSR